MKNRVSIFVLLLLASWVGSAQNKTTFDGGMMLNAGYMQGHLSEINYDAKGLATGIGGVLRFHIGQFLRVGGEGYVTSISQLDNGSYIRTSWGGLSADAYWILGRWTPFAGVTVGGGSMLTLLIFNGSATDWLPEPQALLHNETFMLVAPYAGVEFALTDAVHLTIKADRSIPLSSTDTPTGIRCYLGFVFCH